VLVGWNTLLFARVIWRGVVEQALPAMGQLLRRGGRSSSSSSSSRRLAAGAQVDITDHDAATTEHGEM
jgi:hypothetical protein